MNANTAKKFKCLKTFNILQSVSLDNIGI